MSKLKSATRPLIKPRRKTLLESLARLLHCFVPSYVSTLLIVFPSAAACLHACMVVYGRQKINAESHCHWRLHLSQLPTLLLRPFNGANLQKPLCCTTVLTSYTCAKISLFSLLANEQMNHSVWFSSIHPSVCHWKRRLIWDLIVPSSIFLLFPPTSFSFYPLFRLLPFFFFFLRGEGTKENATAIFPTSSMAQEMSIYVREWGIASMQG